MSEISSYIDEFSGLSLPPSTQKLVDTCRSLQTLISTVRDHEETQQQVLNVLIDQLRLWHKNQEKWLMNDSVADGSLVVVTNIRAEKAAQRVRKMMWGRNVGTGLAVGLDDIIVLRNTFFCGAVEDSIVEEGRAKTSRILVHQDSHLPIEKRVEFWLNRHPCNRGADIFIDVPGIIQPTCLHQYINDARWYSD